MIDPLKRRRRQQKSLWVQLLNYHMFEDTQLSKGGPHHLDQLPLETLYAVLNDGAMLEYEQIHLFGGDPMLSPFLETTLAQAKSLKFKHISVYSSLNLFPDHIKYFVSRHNIKLITCFYSHEAAQHNQLASQGQSWYPLMTHIEECLRLDIDLEVYLPVLGTTHHSNKETELFLTDIGVRSVKYLTPIKTFPDNVAPCDPNDMYISADGTITQKNKSGETSLGSLKQSSLAQLSNVKSPERLKDTLKT